MLNSSAFARLARSVKAVSDELCSGRLVMMHEGGYSETAVPYAGLRVLEEMSGRQTGCVDPYNDEIEVLPYQALQPHQEAVVAAAEAIVKKYLLSST
jgi:acetoin utilization deacetylase AcuC-like enzyme